METVFLKLVNMSFAASWIIMAVIFLRFCLRRAPKNVCCILWALVGIRLLCPFSFESVFSLIPQTETVSFLTEDANIRNSGETSISIKTQEGQERIQQTSPSSVAVPGETKENTAQRRIWIATLIWLAGIVGLAGYAMLSFVRLHGKIREGVPLQDSVWLCDRIDTPFILGVARPRIFLPSTIKETQISYVLAHEKAHLKRHDHWWKPLGYLVLMVHWFNPFVWVAYSLLCKDIELACDEKVIRDYNPQDKKVYSTTLLECSIPHGSFAVCPLAFGEVSVKERVKAVLNYKKPTFWVIAVAAVACVVVAVCFLTNPKSDVGVPANDGKDSRGENADSSLTDREGDPAGKETDMEGEESETGNVVEESMTQQYDFVESWAKAFVNRDGNTIASMTSEAFLSQLGDEELLYEAEGEKQYGFGWSSPWPWDETKDYAIWQVENNQAEIFYYAHTSDPHVTVWKEVISYQKTDGGYEVTGEELQFYEHIASGEEFGEIYSYINGTAMDYIENGLGETLNQNALLSSSDAYRGLFEPETAAILLLNLLDNSGKVEITRLSEETSNGNVGLEIHFTEDDSTYQISMVQPYGKEGIWVPQDFKIDVMGRFQKIPWEEIESRNLSVTGDVMNMEDIVCIGELPKQQIKLYGYNDPECFGEGVAIQIGENVNYFDWYYTTTRTLYPSLFWNEKERQLQVSLKNLSGTGVAAEELHVLQQYDTGALEDYAFAMKNYSALLEEQIGFTYDSGKKLLKLVRLTDHTQIAEIHVPDVEKTVDSLELGCISQFVLGDTIYFQVQPGYIPDGYAMAEYENMPILEAPVMLSREGEQVNFQFGEFQRVSQWRE